MKGYQKAWEEKTKGKITKAKETVKSAHRGTLTAYGFGSLPGAMNSFEALSGSDDEDEEEAAVDGQEGET